MHQGEFLREARGRERMTQAVLADAAVVSTRTVMRAEKGWAISDENLRSICSVLKIDATHVPPLPSMRMGRIRQKMGGCLCIPLRSTQPNHSR